MGYNTYTYIAISKTDEQTYQRLVSWIKNHRDDLDWPVNDWSKWYEMMTDSQFISKQFPSVVFMFLYAGEESDDHSYFIAHNDTYTKLIHLPSKFDDPNSFDDEADDDHDHDHDQYELQVLERFKVLENHIKTMNMIDISHYFTDDENSSQIDSKSIN